MFLNQTCNSSEVDWVFSVASYRNCFVFLRCLFSRRFISTSRFTVMSVASIWQEASPFFLNFSRCSLTPSVSALSVCYLLTRLTWCKTLYQVIAQSRKDQVFNSPCKLLAEDMVSESPFSIEALQSRDLSATLTVKGRNTKCVNNTPMRPFQHYNLMIDHFSCKFDSQWAHQTPYKWGIVRIP